MFDGRPINENNSNEQRKRGEIECDMIRHFDCVIQSNVRINPKDARLSVCMFVTSIMLNFIFSIHRASMSRRLSETENEFYTFYWWMNEKFLFFMLFRVIFNNNNNNTLMNIICLKTKRHEYPAGIIYFFFRKKNLSEFIIINILKI